MTFNISRNYNTDQSRTNVRTILANVAKQLNNARGRDIPTKTVFEEPEIVNEDDNHFAVPVRPAVTAAGFAPTELVSSVHYNGYDIRVTGSEVGGDRDILRVKVARNRGNSQEVEMDVLEDIWANLD